jgi:hypothetical protein
MSLLEVNRHLADLVAMSAYDPKVTLAGPFSDLCLTYPVSSHEMRDFGSRQRLFRTA